MPSIHLSVLLAGLAACGPKATTVYPGPASTPPTLPTAQDTPGRAVQVVNATILANGCQDFGRSNGKLAEKVMYELVEGCSSVPGGAAQFGATLLPDGRIEIAAAPGHPDIVPICVLKHPLMHKVPLAKPCRLDVKVEQMSISLGSDAGARQ